VMKEWPDFEVIRADKISRPGMIDAHVIQHLLDAELVIADLSTLNANAFYEIGIRHMAQKPVIHMQLAEDDIPFDVSLYRAIKFSRRTPLDLRKARDELGIVVKSVLADDYEVDNPVTRARGKIELEARATPNEKVLIDQLSDIERRLEEVERVRVSRSREPNPPKRRIVRIGFEPEHFDEKAQQQARTFCQPSSVPKTSK
jgi:hypothetical protein